jgi:hypothetical protein
MSIVAGLPRFGSTYALPAVAVRNDWIMCQSSSLSWPTMTEGLYTPDAVRAAPKAAPEMRVFMPKVQMTVASKGRATTWS